MSGRTVAPLFRFDVVRVEPDNRSQARFVPDFFRDRHFTLVISQNAVSEVFAGDPPVPRVADKPAKCLGRPGELSRMAVDGSDAPSDAPWRLDPRMLESKPACS